MRLDTVHLAHSGLPPHWEEADVHTFFSDSALETVSVAPGAMRPPLDFPLEVEGWSEVVRFAHRELWPDAGAMGTTVVLATDGGLWVISRGSHRVSLTCEAGEKKLDEVPVAEGRGRLWRLDPSSQWRVEVYLPDDQISVWTARWRPALVPVRREAPAPLAPPALTTHEPSSPVPSWMSRKLDAIAQVARRYPGLIRGAGIAVALVLCALVVANVVPRRTWAQLGLWTGDVANGRYRVRLTSVPAGARIVVDGKETALRTPAWIPLREGRHRVEISLGEYGTTGLDLSGRRGARRSAHLELLGRLALGSADSTVVLYVRLDGRPIGRLPALLDSVPAGTRQISFQGRDVEPWVEEIGVVAGKTTSFVARPERVPDFGVVIARAYRVGQQGLKDLEGAAVVLDGTKVGVTPTKLTVPRGLHTVRLASGSENSPVQLLRVEGGGELYATAEFGRSPEPSVTERLTGAASVSKPPSVQAVLVSPTPMRIAEMRLSVRRWGREYQRFSMTVRSTANGWAGEALLPLPGLSAGTDVSYFVTAKSDDGEEFVSEIRKIRLVP